MFSSDSFSHQPVLAMCFSIHHQSSLLQVLLLRTNSLLSLPDCPSYYHRLYFIISSPRPVPQDSLHLTFFLSSATLPLLALSSFPIALPQLCSQRRGV
ncbi:hypothetical protein AQUCO_00200094v1 [Aquilegia coerulea]|uniref:Uncharacterized protein n=1 Tax=Aquilegia coerulea TaxID=218851 RepID=A0A2G5F1F3_AQUCA|nr:hypothetical protein AQUCO_00200094v1 [Aquilegia coerulea]